MNNHILTLCAAIFLTVAAYGRDTGLPAPPDDGKSIEVQKINYAVDQPVLVPEIFAKEGISYQKINTINFGRTYPFIPDVSFAIAYTDDAILIHYKVSEASVRAVAKADNGRVWEDACCEFFSSPDPENDSYYYNLEANCAGKILIEFGLAKGERELASQEVLQSVRRWSTLQGEPFDTRDTPTAWQMALVVPFRSFYFHHDIQTLEGRTIRANFYKCGDLLPVPHSLSWSPIYPPARHFHSPGFFGTLYFKP